MGFDLNGATGANFCRSSWTWRPLSAYVRALAPHLCSKCSHWDTNDGDGLDRATSELLASAIDRALANGSARAYIDGRNDVLANLPDIRCPTCDGTGQRASFGKCGGCNGLGQRRPYDTYYTFDLDDVRSFADFIRASHGFTID